MSGCLVVELIMFVLGILGMVKGKVSLTRTRVAIGPPARRAAAVMLIPLPIGIVAEAFMGLAVFGAIPQNKDDPTLALIGSGAYLIEIAVTLLCLLIAIAICAVNATPVSARKAAAKAITKEDLEYFGDGTGGSLGNKPSEPDERIEE